MRFDPGSQFTPSGKNQPMFRVPKHVLAMVVLMGLFFAALNLLPQDMVRGLLSVGLVISSLYSYLELGNPAFWLGPILYGFMHIGLAHFIVNIMMLISFLSPLSKRTSSLGLWLFFLMCSVAGALLFVISRYIISPDEPAAMLGASAGVSGALGALIGLSLIKGDHFPPPAPFHRKKTALWFAIVWFALNFMFVVLPAGAFGAQGAVAWEAHLGGFLCGMLTFRFFDKMRLSKMTSYG